MLVSDAVYIAGPSSARHRAVHRGGAAQIEPRRGLGRIRRRNEHQQLRRALVVTRRPGRLEPGWLGALQELDGELDVSLHLHPNAGPAVMNFLDRRIAELSSTVRIAEEHGGRVDAYRRVALRDAVELQERIAQGSEWLFDVSLYVAAWAHDGETLDAATRRVEALLGSRLVHSLRLRFQMRGDDRRTPTR